jgi:hypothetical protein
MLNQTHGTPAAGGDPTDIRQDRVCQIKTNGSAGFEKDSRFSNEPVGSTS